MRFAVNRWWGAVVSGVLLSVAFPKIGMGWIAWGALVPLFFAMRATSGKARFWLGFGTGCVHYFSLIYWLVPTLRIYGELPLVVAVVLFLLLSMYLAVYIGLFTFIMTGIQGRRVSGIFAAPVVWVGLEYIRSFILSGFPWELLGYSQGNWLTLIQIVDITGVYGVSFLIVLVNTAIFYGLLWLTRRSWHDCQPSSRGVACSGLLIVILIMAALGYGVWRLKMVDSTLAEAEDTRRISVLQGNIDQSRKWEAAFKHATVEKYLALSDSASQAAPFLMVMPETAMPFFFMYESDLTARIKKQARDLNVYILTGAPSFEKTAGGRALYNSAYLIAPDGEVVDRYDKSHLVPFGEYIPLGDWFPFMEQIVFGSGDFSSGKASHVLEMGQWDLGIQICFEIIFPSAARLMTKNGADVLVNITNDGWYGRTSAPYQHFSMTVFRAVENRRSLVRSANTGISGFVDPAGRIVGATRLFTKCIDTYKVPACGITSVYTQVGDVFAKVCIVLMVFVLWRRYGYNTIGI